ncbi:response regulator transcription factor [Pseudonocardia eucalypti]|uniref:Response regulator transcription factor n=1 Tax=Pseudonocardia eucalypti TaxID=648755 RepID=A0ABP9PIP7_9PSEU|nr:DNA-binding NarL/FixJ family response regulator [Pseudonocardia eucalypti]
MIRTLLVDDQRLVRAGLRMLCEASADVQVVGEAQDGQQAITMVDRLVPDVVLMDLRMPGVDGITATQRILAGRPTTRIVVLTTFDDDEHLYPALAAGACGFLAKDTAPETLLDGVRRAAAGDSPFSPDVLRRVVSRAVASAPGGHGRPAVTLTERERDVLALLASGYSNAEIGQRLYIGVTTVKTHVANLMAKTQSRNRVQLALAAGRLGIADAD